MKILLIAVPFIILSFLPLHSKERIEWIDSVYNFGLIKEDDGPRRGEFKFVNQTDHPLLIHRVKSSCGCTTVEFTRDFVNKGDTAFIKFLFNPARRSGKFEKELKVYFDKPDSAYTLKFNGTVLGNEQTLALTYPYNKGDLRFERLNLQTDTLLKGMKRHLFLEIYNQGLDSVTPIVSPGMLSQSSPYLVTLTPEVIPTGESSTLMLEIDSSKITGYGKKNFELPLRWENDSVGINISTIILPDISDNGKETSGQIKICNAIIEIQKLTKDEEVEFEIENSGEGTLHLYGILAENEDWIKAIYPEEIRKGEKGNLKIMVKSDKVPNGVFRINFDIISDDSYFPLSSCRIVGTK